MFEKSLQDLVKGIRAANNDSAAYIAKAIQEIKDELKSRDVTIKAQALQKLTYVREKRRRRPPAHTPL
jgi:AP-3 complex subunit delta-1